jgi:hypothetical protein
MNRAKAGDLLIKGNPHPVTINNILCEFFPEWVLWEPESIWAAIRSISAQGTVPFLIQHKVSAIQTLHKNEGPWEDWEVFNWVNQPFNDDLANFQYAKRPSLPELYVTVATMEHIRKREFGDEVVSYIAAACLDDGIFYTPAPLAFAQDTLNIVEYRCTLCGNVDLIEENNRCDYCNAPASALIKTPRYFDWKEVRDKWKSLENVPMQEIVLEESVTDVHIAKLANALMILDEREDQLKQELKNVAS